MFEYNGTQYTLNDLTLEADKQGLDVDAFISKMKNIGMKEVSGDSFSEQQDDDNIFEQGINFAYKKLKGFASGGLRLVDDIVDLAEFSGKMNNPTSDIVR